MGEIADMMLDGTMCQGCGVWLHDGADGPGYPGYCRSCARDMRENEPSQSKRSDAGPSMFKTNCPTCGKRVKKVGLAHHQRDVHGVGKSDGD